MKKLNLTWDNIESLCDKIAKEYDFSGVKYLYGMPRGGLIPAVILSHKTGIPLMTDKFPQGWSDVLIVDDIYDTGRTLEPLLTIGYKCVTLTNKSVHEDVYSARQVSEWVVFPWETQKSSKADYITNGK